jgi:hypothetical protein
LKDMRLVRGLMRSLRRRKTKLPAMRLLTLRN